jgi:hypothetical protein
MNHKKWKQKGDKQRETENKMKANEIKNKK